jgi:hypothetical protein
VPASSFWRKRSCGVSQLGSSSYGQDLAVQIVDQANRAVAHFKTTLSENSSVIKTFNDQQSGTRDALQRIARQLGIPTVAPCSEQDKSTIMRVTVLTVTLDGIKSQIDTALATETEQSRQLQRSYSIAQSTSAPYLTQISMYDKLVWSNARSQMISVLKSILEGHRLAAQLSIENTCLSHKLLASNRLFDEADKIIREQTVQDETQQTRMTASSREFFHNMLSLIMSMR